MCSAKWLTSRSRPRVHPVRTTNGRSQAPGFLSDVGTSSSKLSVTATTADDESLYRVVVSNPSGTVTSSLATLSIAPSAASTKVKPLIQGLIDKGVQGPYDASQPFPATPTSELAGYGAAFSGIVVNVTWAQLEPTMGTVDFTPLDASLAAVSTYNSSNPADPLKVKLGSGALHRPRVGQVPRRATDQCSR